MEPTASGIGTPIVWGAFAALVTIVLAIDLGVFHRGKEEVSFREATLATALRVGLAIAFGAWLWVAHGAERGLEFATGYLIELALSVDNVFVFLVIFASFGVRPSHQYRVLFWGVLGALALRGAFIAAGTALFDRFEWMTYPFGLFLLLAAVKLARHSPAADVRPDRSLVVRVFRRFVPLVRRYHGDRFVIRRRGRVFATPLLLVLVAVEASDVAFAVESVPTVLAITRDPFVVYTSNVFAILGLRSMFFLVSGAVARFTYLNVALSTILGFIGTKMLVADVVHVPVGVSLAVVVTILAVAVAASWRRATAGQRAARKRPLAA
jgi:TerC family integral membrane protein